MGQFRISNRLITTPLVEILQQIRHECGNMTLTDIREKKQQHSGYLSLSWWRK